MEKISSQAKQLLFPHRVIVTTTYPNRRGGSFWVSKFGTIILGSKQSKYFGVPPKYTPTPGLASGVHVVLGAEGAQQRDQKVVLVKKTG